jgi:anti-sigma-K factor RskA
VPLRRRRHEEVEETAELAALADGSLAPDRRVALEARVAASPDLAAQLADQRRALALLDSAAAETEAPSALRARVDALRRPRRTRGGWRPVMLGTAAAAVAVVAFAVVARNEEPGGERFHATLGPTDLVPDARGEATMTKTDSGWRIELDATGLPRLDGGRFYEAWLRDASGQLVPIGTFNEGRNVMLWAGVSPKNFPTLTVTREQDDGDQSSSGEKVLVGTVSTGG